MAGISANAWDVVVLRSLDRWVRRPAELERIIDEVEKSKVQVEAIHGEIELRTRQGRLSARLLTAVAMHEAEAITERVIDWHQDRAARGLPFHSKPGYGFHRPKGSSELTIVDEEADRIREAARRVLAPEPLRSIAVSWNELGVPAPGAGRWTSGMIRRILLAPRTAGLREHRGEIVANATWPPILDRETWDRVVRLLTNPARNSVPIAGGRAPRLLTGLAACGKCLRPLNHMTDRRNPDSAPRRYFCRHCHGTTIRAVPFEELVEAMLFDAVDSPHLARTLGRHETNVDTAAIADEIIRLEADLAELATELGDGRLTMPEWKAARQGIDRRLTALRAELEHDETSTTLAPWAGKPGALRAAWEADELTVPEKRVILAAVFETIVVGPAVVGDNRFNPDRVHPVWR